MLGIIFGIIVILIAVYCYWRFFYFFRDPERKISKDKKTIICPADGTIVYVKKVAKGIVPISNKKGREISLEKDIKKNDKEEKWLIGIFMTPFDVHVQRSPIDGKVEYCQHYKHKNLPMTLMWLRVILRLKPFYTRSLHMWENERNVVSIKGKIKVYVIQIADIAVNKVVCFLKKGQKVKKGARLGIIKFGSQVDIVLPYKRVNVKVKEGMKVKAGETVLGFIK